MNSEIYEACQKIRCTEESLLDLFVQGKMNGTIHTCVGQELASFFVINQLSTEDYIFSNHRCHGHYLHRFNDPRSLIAELMGKKSGMCSGIGSSQHICRETFFSNGLQGGIVPLAAGAAYSSKLRNSDAISVVFIGDGTLGEGSIYETFNIAAILELPLLVVCEDNGFAQSTRKVNAFRGNVESRVSGFGLNFFHSSMWNENELESKSIDAVQYVKKSSKPAFLHIDTYRLNSHSKSDDNRDVSEIEEFRKIDPLVLYSEKNKELTEKIDKKILEETILLINEISKDGEISLSEYIEDHFEHREVSLFHDQDVIGDISQKRVVERINDFFHSLLSVDDRAFFLGEDVSDPYGGAFKVSKGLSDRFPKQVFSSPISEQAIAGISNGMALTGIKPYLEIMFGDFMTLVFDQLLNHASKFYYMYDKQVTCPVVIRTPVGGGRGYGPTHSQAIEKLVVGLDCVRVVAIDAFRDPFITYSEIHQSKHPVVVIENKAGYGRYVREITTDFYEIRNGQGYLSNTQIVTTHGLPNVTIVTYGESASRVAAVLDELFESYEVIVDLHVLTSLYPLNTNDLIESAQTTKKVLIIEESSEPFGLGSEISAQLTERLPNIKIKRLGAMSVPIPSIRSLEESVLNFDKIFDAVEELMQ